MSVRFVVGALLVASCAGHDGASETPTSRPERVSQTSSGIQGGLPDTSSTWVVGVVNEAFGTICSGALIAPNLILSTRHCVDYPPNEAVDCAASQFSVVTADNDMLVATCSNIHDLGQSDCKWHRSQKIFRPTASFLCGDDIALLELQAPFAATEAVPALPLVDAVISAKVQALSPFSLIGFGAVNAYQADWGVRRRIDSMNVSCVGGEAGCSNLVFGTGVSPNEFVSATPATCDGDSGGPAELTIPGYGPAIFGFASRAAASGGHCLSSVFGRVQPWSEFIRQSAVTAAADGSYPVAPWADPKKLPMGGTCSVDADCASQVCRPWGSVKRCTNPCDAAVSQVCAAGTTCQDQACLPVPGSLPAPTQSCALTPGAARTGWRGATGSLAIAVGFFAVALARLRRRST